jgi:hypothetical protein
MREFRTCSQEFATEVVWRGFIGRPNELVNKVLATKMPAALAKLLSYSIRTAEKQVNLHQIRPSREAHWAALVEYSLEQALPDSEVIRLLEWVDGVLQEFSPGWRPREPLPRCRYFIYPCFRDWLSRYFGIGAHRSWLLWSCPVYIGTTHVGGTVDSFSAYRRK